MRERDVPAPLFDLALNPDDPQQLMAATEAGLALSTDGGRRWRSVDGHG